MNRVIFPQRIVWLTCKSILLLKNSYLLRAKVKYLFFIIYRILNGNEIASITETAFENVSDLLDLELNNNRLTLLPAGVFENLAKLRKL